MDKRSGRKWILRVLNCVTTLFLVFCPRLAVAGDLPNNQQTPEGAAVLMAKAFIEADSALWKSIQSPKLMRNEELSAFVKEITKQMEEVKKLDPQKRPGPVKILEVRKKGYLSQNGPNSYAYAALNFRDIGFVDVVVADRTGRTTKNRTFVCQEKDLKWYVLPRPDLFPLLTSGINDEPVPDEIIWKLDSAS